MWIWQWPVERARLQTHVSHLEHEIERLTHEYELIRADYAALVMVTGSRTLRPDVKSLGLDFDPFAEDQKQPDEWLTPGPDEPVNTSAVETALTELATDA